MGNDIEKMVKTRELINDDALAFVKKQSEIYWAFHGNIHTRLMLRAMAVEMKTLRIDFIKKLVAESELPLHVVHVMKTTIYDTILGVSCKPMIGIFYNEKSADKFKEWISAYSTNVADEFQDCGELFYGIKETVLTKENVDSYCETARFCKSRNLYTVVVSIDYDKFGAVSCGFDRLVWDRIYKVETVYLKK